MEKVLDYLLPSMAKIRSRDMGQAMVEGAISQILNQSKVVEILENS